MSDWASELEQEYAFELPDENETNTREYPLPVATEYAAMGSMILNGDVESDFEQISYELNVQGTSPTLDTIKQRAIAQDTEFLKETIGQIIVDPNIPPEEAAELIKLTEGSVDPTVGQIGAEFMRSAMFLHDPDDAELEEIQTNRYRDELVQSLQKTDNEVMEKAIFNALSSSDGGFFDGITGISEGIVPVMGEAKIVRDLYEHMTGNKYNDWLPSVLNFQTGGMRQALRDHAKSLTSEEFEAWAMKASDFLKQNSGLIKDTNGFESMIVLQDVLSGDYGEPEAWVDSVTAFLDYAVVGAVIKAVKHPFKAAGRLNRSNPAASRRIRAAVLSSENPQANRTVQATDSDIIMESQLPGWNNTILSGAPDDVVGAVVEIQEEAAGIFEKMAVSSATLNRRIKDIVSSYGKGKLKINATTISRNEGGGVTVNATVGRTGNEGFKSIQGLERSAKARGFDLDEIKIFKRDMDTGDLVPATDRTKGEYFYQFERVEDIPADNIFLKEDIDLTDVKAGFGFSTRYFKDVYSIFNKKTAYKLGGLEDRREGTVAAILRLTETYQGLPTRGKERVLQTLIDGSAAKREFTYEDLVAGGDDTLKHLTDDEFIAYQEMRAVSDLNWNAKDRQLTEFLKNNDFKAIESEGFNYHGQELSIEAAEEAIDRVPEVLLPSGAIGHVDEGVLNAISKGKGKLFQLRGMENVGGRKVSYLYVAPEEVGKIKDIPEMGNLPKIDGYVYRNYEGNYFIEKFDPRITVNGSKEADKTLKTYVVGAAADPRSASSMLEDLKGALTPEEIEAGVTLEARLGREVIDSGDGDAYDFAKAHGLLHKGKRGQVLGGLDGEHADLISVSDSIKKSVNEAASIIAVRPIVETLEKQFVKDYGDLLNTKGLFPMDASGFKPNTNILPQDAKRLDQAKAAWEYIHNISRFEDPVTSGYQKTLFKLGNYMDAKFGADNLAVKLGRKIGEATGLNRRDPLDFARGLTFTAYLALNPARQLPLQIAQHLMIAPLAPAYVASGKIYKDTAALVLGSTVRHSDNWAKHKDTLAKLRGMSVKQFEEEVDGWLASGLPTSVDSHNFNAGVLFDAVEEVGKGVGGKAMTQVGNALKMPVRFARKIGFNAGEHGNLALTWNVARRLLEKEGKRFTARDIAEKARSMSLGMSRSGELKYQRGWLKAATQFMSFQHKAWMSIMPQALGGSRAFTTADKWKMVVPQVLYSGASGLGVYAAVNWVHDQYSEATGETLSDESWRIIAHGLGNYAINEALSALTGEDERLDLSPFAPLSGTTVAPAAVFDFILGADQSLISKMFGASGSFGGKLWEEAALVSEIFGMPQVDVDTKVMAAMERLARTTSAYNNYTKGLLAESLGYYQDKHGNPTVAATAASAQLTKWLGITPTTMQQYYETKASAKDRARALQQAARLTARAMIEISKQNSDADMVTLSELIKDHNAYLTILANAPDARINQEFNIIKQMLSEELTKSLEKPAARKLTEQLISNWSTYGPEWVFKKVQEIESMTPEQAEVLKQLLDDPYKEPAQSLRFKYDDKEEDK